MVFRIAFIVAMIVTGIFFIWNFPWTALIAGIAWIIAGLAYAFEGVATNPNRVV